MFQQFFLTAFPEPVRDGLFFAIKLAPIWLPIMLIAAIVKLWMTYVRANFIASQEMCVLELIFPREVEKSPLAMEAVLNGMHNQSGEAHYFGRWWRGQVRPWWSLEIASIEGNVHFYIWTRKSLKKFVEAAFYAQYPDIDVIEVPDYTRNVRFDLDEMTVWGMQHFPIKPSPWPIKTYIDYGMDKNPKESEKVDPLNNIVEFFASIGPGEQLWYQIIMRNNKKEKKAPGKLFEYWDFKDWCEYEIQKIYDNPRKINFNEETGTQLKTLSSSQDGDIEKIERKKAKFAYDIGIRGLYIVTDLDKFNPANIGGLINGFKQFSDESFNTIRAGKGMMGFDFPWQDYNDIRANRERYKLFDGFRRRSFFYAPYKYPHFVLNTEEIATIFHPIGSVLATPTIERVESKREGPPGNLPV